MFDNSTEVLKYQRKRPIDVIEEFSGDVQTPFVWEPLPIFSCWNVDGLSWPLMTCRNWNSRRE